MSRQLFSCNVPAVVVAIGFGALGLPAAALQPLITDDTGTQGERANQIELSIDADHARAADQTKRTRTATITLTLTRGLTDRLDVFAGIGYLRARSSEAPTASGAGNPALGVKWRGFESDASKTSFAVKAEVLLPVSREREASGLGNGRTSAALTFIVSQEAGFGSVHANLAASNDRLLDPAAPNSTTLLASIAPVWDVAPGWKLAADLGHASERAGGVTLRSRFAEIGAIYAPNENVEMAFGLIRSANSDVPRVTTNSATLGVTWRFQ